MSTETVLKSLIEPLVAGGCHSHINKDNPLVVPYVVFYQISGIPVYTIKDYSGITECRYQIDVFARTLEQAKVLALGTIKTAIEGNSTVQGTLGFEMAGQYSSLDKTHQYITEYSIWAA